MTFDETELIEFFGVLPVSENQGEQEFFGSSQFKVTQRKLTLHISFSSTHIPKVIADLQYADSGDSILHVEIQEAMVVRIDKNLHKLVILAEKNEIQRADPSLEERIIISLDPLNVVISS